MMQHDIQPEAEEVRIYLVRMSFSTFLEINAEGFMVFTLNSAPCVNTDPVAEYVLDTHYALNVTASELTFLCLKYEIQLEADLTASNPRGHKFMSKVYLQERVNETEELTITAELTNV